MMETLDQLDPRLVLWAIGALLLAVVVLWSYGRLRRFAARRALLVALKDTAYEVLSDVLIPDGMDGQLHVDFLLLTQRGILVLDLREVPGVIFGGDQMDEWAVMTRTRRFTFTNPQGLLLDRIAAVKALSGDVPVEGRVLFTSRAQFPKGRPKSVLMLDSLKVEFAPVEKATMESVVASFRPGWEMLKASAARSHLGRR